MDGQILSQDSLKLSLCQLCFMDERHGYFLNPISISFQAKIGKRILGISKLLKQRFSSESYPNYLIGMTVSAHTIFASDDVYAVSLAQHCLSLSLEQQIGTRYLQLCLENPTNACSIVCDAKENILAKYWIYTLQDSRYPTGLVTDGIASAWNSIWLLSMAFGVPGLCRTSLELQPNQHPGADCIHGKWSSRLLCQRAVGGVFVQSACFQRTPRGCQQ